MSMSVTAETLVLSHENISEMSPDPTADRRADIDAKQARVATLLQECKCEGLLVLDPDNFTWLSSGAAARGILNPADLPALYFTADGRWVIARNVDSQRLFDEELDGLGFQLKEWPWHWGRTQLLADLCQGRAVACDEAVPGSKPIADRLQSMRRTLTAYDRACLRALGAIVSHALEATCRTLTPGETEREIAGQLAHRLMHRGVQTLYVGVAADGRSRKYRHFGFTAAPVQTHCLAMLTGRKYGLCASASRTVCFGAPDSALQKEHNAVCKIHTSYLASTWPDAVPSQILAAGKRVFQVSGAEHEWLLGPQGHVTGRTPVELALTAQTGDLFQPGWAITWNPTVGAASSCDTYLVGDDGPETITAVESWPVKRIRIQGAEFTRPDILQR
jgi:Xaa-Pro aminopeptidase